jgi:hypothetical protein
LIAAKEKGGKLVAIISICFVGQDRWWNSRKIGCCGVFFSLASFAQLKLELKSMFAIQYRYAFQYHSPALELQGSLCAHLGEVIKHGKDTSFWSYSKAQSRAQCTVDRFSKLQMK